MKNKFLKPALALALALSVVTPSVKTSFAADTSASETSAITSKEKYEKAYKNAIARLAELKEVKNSVKYINEANNDKKYLFDGSLKDFEKTITEYSPENVKSYVSDNEFDTATNTINDKLSEVLKKYNKLSGTEVNTKELRDLFYDNASFKASDAYKNARLSQQNSYEKAISMAKDALSKYENISTTEYNEALKALKDARGSIKELSNVSKVKEELKEEIKEAGKIDKALYTEKSYLVFKKALVAAQTTANTTNSTKEQYQTSLEALKAAKDSLVKFDSEKEKELKALIVELKKSLEQHRIQAQALRYLLETKPKTIKSVKPKLEQLLKESNELVKETQKFLDDVENVQG